MKKNAQIELRTYYKSLLAGISVNGRSIPVINLARVGTKPPYILIFGGNATPSDTKTSYNDEVSINVNVHTDFAADAGGEAIADQITDEILNKVYAVKGIYGNTDNFKIVTCTYDIEESARTMSNTSVHIIRQITFTHFVEQI